MIRQVTFGFLIFMMSSCVTNYQHSNRARDTTAIRETIQAAVARQDTQNRMSASARVPALGVDAELDRYIQEAPDVCPLADWSVKTCIHCWPLLQKTWCQLCLYKPIWSVFSQPVAISTQVNVIKHVLAVSF